MDKLNGESQNIVSENIAKLIEIFPEIYKEGKIDFDTLKAELGDIVESNDERYSFNWNGKQNARRIAQTPSTGTLRPCIDESVDWESTQNLFIEGDNLEVLKLLQKSYHSKVKMIYIDPPYNTGKEFIYPDNYQDNLDTYLEYTGQKDSEGRKFGTNAETSGRYHTNWLNMMYPRLKLARNLLRDDGVIFISIDDNEVHNLRKICDEIFGEGNFVACIVWQKRTAPDMRTTFSNAHDYILIYGKTPQGAGDFNKLPLTQEQIKRYKNPDDDPKGAWVSSDYTALGVRPNQLYGIKTPSGKVYYPPEGKCWQNVEETYLKQLAEGRFYFGLHGDSVPRRKNYLSDTEGKIPWTWWSNDEVGHSQEGKVEINQIFEKSEVFSTPKPCRLIKRIIEVASKADSIVLDFFAGSSSTAHAVMKLNSEDGGNRRYILVQLPEPCDEASEAYKAGYKTIAEIGKERIRRAAKKIQEENQEAKCDFGFKLFKLDSSNIKAWDSDFDNVEQNLINAIDNIKEDRSSEDLLYEILLKYGLDLTVPIETRICESKAIYILGAGALVICLDDRVSLSVVESIAHLKSEYNPEVMRVVFKDNGFENDVVKTNTLQILKQHGIDDVKSV